MCLLEVVAQDRLVLGDPVAGSRLEPVGVALVQLGPRVVPALLGAANVGLPYVLRRLLGSAAALTSAVLLCLSPTYLYYTRFDREDVYAVALTLGLIVAVFRFLEKPQRWHPSLVLGLLAASFATKETTYITVFVAGTFFVGVAAHELRRLRRDELTWEGMRLLGPVRSVGGEAWVWGSASFLAVFTLLFTTFLTNPSGLQDGLVESIRYWLSQQPVGRGSQPWFYYFVLLPAYELPAVVLAVIGAATAVRGPSLLQQYLVWAAVLDLAVYTWAGEKMPWLLMHPLLPIILLAGVGLQSLWRARGLLLARAGLAAAVLAALPMLWGTAVLNYRHPADPAELLVFTQASPDIVRTRDRLVAIERRVLARTGEPLRIEVDTHYSMDWPWHWYLRDFRGASFVPMDDGLYLPGRGAQALLVANEDKPWVLARLHGFVGYRFHHRAWWVPDYGGASAADVGRWLVHRKPWNPRGYLDEWLYVRKSLDSRARIAPAIADAPGK